MVGSVPIQTMIPCKGSFLVYFLVPRKGVCSESLAIILPRFEALLIFKAISYSPCFIPRCNKREKIYLFFFHLYNIKRRGGKTSSALREEGVKTLGKGLFYLLQKSISHLSSFKKKKSSPAHHYHQLDWEGRVPDYYLIIFHPLVHWNERTGKQSLSLRPTLN